MDLAAAVSLTELRKSVRTLNKPVVDNVEPSNQTTAPSTCISVISVIVPQKTSVNAPQDKKKACAPALIRRPAPFYYYIDRSEEIDEDPLTPLTPPGRVPNFPATMYAILCDPALKDVIAWMPHGRSWRILNPRELEIRVLPKYFNHNKFSSFVRQTNGWGFRRITKGPDRHSYYNENFLRGLPHLCKKMMRVGSASKVTIDPSFEPDLYEINKLHPLPTSNFVDESINFQVSKGPRTRMPVTYGAFDATKGNRAINPCLFKRKTIDDTPQLVLQQLTKQEQNEDHIKQKHFKVDPAMSKSSNPACNVLSSSLREISSLHLQAAYRAQMLSEIYNNNIMSTMQAMPNSNSANIVPNFNQIMNFYQQQLMGNPSSVDAKLQENLPSLP